MTEAVTMRDGRTVHLAPITAARVRKEQAALTAEPETPEAPAPKPKRKKATKKAD